MIQYWVGLLKVAKVVFNSLAIWVVSLKKKPLDPIGCCVLGKLSLWLGKRCNLEHRKIRFVTKPHQWEPLRSQWFENGCDKSNDLSVKNRSKVHQWSADPLSEKHRNIDRVFFGHWLTIGRLPSDYWRTIDLLSIGYRVTFVGHPFVASSSTPDSISLDLSETPTQ